ncbi:hypothetical protein AB0E01_40335 [Nocardia vinacea]|uniref:hypothetical protein n=1 Tax=Nocardia vinacea TaxID=96468 RepID=UPI0033E53444
MTKTPDMPPLYVPDQYGNGYPRDEKPYQISVPFLNLVDYELVKVIFDGWKALGSGETTDMPKPGNVMPVNSSGAAGKFSDTIANYSEKLDKLNKAFDNLQKTVVNVDKTVQGAKADRSAYQSDYTDLIDSLNNAAGTPPEDGITMDEYIMNYATLGMDAASKTMQAAWDKQSGNASKIKDQADAIKDLTQQLKDEKALADKLQKELDELKKTGTGTGTGTGSYDPTQVTPANNGTGTGTGSDGDWSPIDLGADGSTSDGSSDGTGTGTGGSDGTGTGAGSTGSGDSGYPSSTTPVSATSPDSGMGSSLGSGMGDMMNSLGQQLQQLAQQQQMRDMMNQYGQNGLAQQQPLAAQPAVAAQPQAQAQPAATTAPGAPASSTPPPGASSSQPGQPAGAVPGHTPDADGMVEYPFPDGRTQRVSAVVAQALDAAFGNQSGTDAQAAYAKTPAKWSDNKQIGKAVDPNDPDMVTGAVAVWKNRTALVAKFGTPDSSGTLEGIIAGKLALLTDDNLHQMSDRAGEFGEFSGWVRPHGIEAAAAGDQSGGAPGGTPMGDQSGAPMLAATGGTPA